MSFIARLQRAREILEQPGRLSTRALERELEIRDARPHQKIVLAATMNTSRAMTTHAPASRARLVIEAKRGEFLLEVSMLFRAVTRAERARLPAYSSSPGPPGAVLIRP